MADLAVWQRTIVDEKGDVIPGAAVEVRSYPGGSLITLYEGPDGAQVKGNPFSTGSDGFARFWADSQRAEIVAHGAGSAIRWVVDLINADEVIGDAVSEATAAAAVAVGEAKAEADRAEAARDAAQLNAGVYADTAAGLAATTDGDYFSVPSEDDDEYLILYRNDNGSATEVRRYPSAGLVDGLAGGTEYYRLAGDPVRPSGRDYAWSIKDASGRMPVALTDDGALRVARLEPEALSMHGVETKASTNYAWAITDGEGKVAIGVREDGMVIANIEGGSSGGGSSIPRIGGIYTHQLNYICNAGQSLGEGSDGAITTVQEYDNVGFPARSVDPTSYLPLTVANTQPGTRGESPMYGTLGSIKERIAADYGITYTQNDYQMLACNNAYGGTPIANLVKGGSTGAFEAALSQVQAGHNIAASEGRTFAFQAVTWTQGERDIVDGTSEGDYLAALLKLADDYNTDGKAITNQPNDVAFITYQTCRDGGQGTVASAQLKASDISPLIHLATPIYQLSFYDFQHIDAISSKWLGGYYGLVYKTVVIDQKKWMPLRPLRHAVVGNSVDLFFSKTGLVLDTDAVPEQPDYGFSAVDENDDAVSISSVRLMGGGRLRLTFASAPQAGWSIRYGWNSAVGRADPFTGGCGNLRDSQGDYLRYAAIDKPLHNWCVIFSYEV